MRYETHKRDERLETDEGVMSNFRIVSTATHPEFSREEVQQMLSLTRAYQRTKTASWVFRHLEYIMDTGCSCGDGCDCDSDDGVATINIEDYEALKQQYFPAIKEKEYIYVVKENGKAVGVYKSEESARKHAMSVATTIIDKIELEA